MSYHGWNRTGDPAYDVDKTWNSENVLVSYQSVSARITVGSEMRILRVTIKEEDFLERANALLRRGRGMIQRDRYLRAPESQLEISAERVRGLEELVWGLAPEGRQLTTTEKQVRSLVVSSRRYSQFIMARMEEPIVLVIPMESGVTMQVPYTTTAMTVRQRFGKIPEPGEVSEDISRFLNQYPGWIGNVILSTQTRNRGGVEAEVRRVVGVYARRRESYLSWVSLFFDAYDLYKAQVRDGVELDLGEDSGEEDDSDTDSEGGTDMGGGPGQGAGHGRGGRGGGGTDGASPTPALAAA